MTLEVIGSGLGRTGTKTLQTALNLLGKGPCHHMAQVFLAPQTMPVRVAAANGRPDWEQIFTGYASAVDYPAAAFWRELADYYPNAKVIHTTRDADAWFESTQATIFAEQGPIATALSSPGHPASEFFASFTRPFVEKMNDKAFMIDYFNQHHENVLASLPAERLLVYDVSQGWDPLCRFLGTPVPDEPFPAENTRAQYAERAATYRASEHRGRSRL